MGGVWSYGHFAHKGIDISYRTGFGVLPQKVPRETKHAVLVLNSKDESKIPIAREWLKSLGKLGALQTVGIVLHASEECSNSWLIEWLASPHSFQIRFVFLVYGPSSTIPNITTPLFHWPLGPAYYRKFPEIDPLVNRSVLADPVNAHRTYLCNFLGTVYNNSIARNNVERILKDPANRHWNCFLKARADWVATETSESQREYLAVTQHSDYTLCPPGYNVEAYRIYEAMTFGSVPILQYGVNRISGDLQGDSYLCEDSFRLLKEHNAPVIWLEDWSELAGVLNELQRETAAQTYQRRCVDPSRFSADIQTRCRLAVVVWLQRFKGEMAAQFLDALELLRG